MVTPDGGWLAQCTGLFFETFLQEDLAIVTGGVLVVKDKLPLVVVIITLFFGILTGDIIIYGMGHAARYIPWVHKRLVNARVENARKKLKNNLIPSIAFVRIMPGLLFPTFLACGLVGISFTQFLLTTMVASVIYTSILLTIVIKLGEVVFPSIGYWGWIIMISLVLLIITYKSLKPRWLKLTNNTSVQALEYQDVPQIEKTIPGMPSLRALNRKVSVSEKINPYIFYTPLGFRWLMLGIRYRNLTLPTIANPFIEAGGLWGESKSKLMSQVADGYQHWIAPYATLKLNGHLIPEEWLKHALIELDKAAVTFPFVIKPDIGWQGFGVRIMNNETELIEYFRTFPVNNTVIMQTIIPYDGEAGVFYCRLPGEPEGKVISLTLRYYPHIIGNGKSSVLELIMQDERTNFKSRFYLGNDNLHEGISSQFLETVPQYGEIVQLAFIGSIRVGGLYRNGEEFITPELSRRFDEISCSMPEFYFGRFDIKFRSVGLLKKGTDFQIFEINGAGAEAIHVWDTETPILKTYRELFRYQSMLFRISNINRKRGYKPMGIKNFIDFSKQYKNLINTYPPSQ